MNSEFEPIVYCRGAALGLWKQEMIALIIKLIFRTKLYRNGARHILRSCDASLGIHDLVHLLKRL